MGRLKALAATTALALTTGGGALAAATGYTSNVKIAYARGSHAFSGRVTSTRQACTKGRGVAVYRQRAGADPSIGSTISSASGHWRLKLNGAPTPGYYYAKAKASSVGPAWARSKCKPAYSAVTRAS
ncbi:MAG: hypothetical protein U0R52_11530 [Solirubrobacterales bacterium]